MSDKNENTINEQNNIPGQQKEVDVKDYPYASVSKLIEGYGVSCRQK
jgi:hypothetical protein